MAGSKSILRKKGGNMNEAEWNTPLEIYLQPKDEKKSKHFKNTTKNQIQYLQGTYCHSFMVRMHTGKPFKRIFPGTENGFRINAGRLLGITKKRSASKQDIKLGTKHKTLKTLQPNNQLQPFLNMEPKET